MESTDVKTIKIKPGEKLHNRFPMRREILLLFAACAFPVHLWGIITMLIEVPALIRKASIFELIGALAYTLSFLLFESLVVTGLLILVAAILPSRILKNKIVAQGSVLALISAGWAMSLHPQGVSIQNPHLIPYLIAVVVAYILIDRFAKLEALIKRLVAALTVLSFTLVAFDFISLFIVLFRNIF
jgi:hypothetical protein